jgi:hypothetical protein
VWAESDSQEIVTACIHKRQADLHSTSRVYVTLARFRPDSRSQSPPAPPTHPCGSMIESSDHCLLLCKRMGVKMCKYEEGREDGNTYL